MNYYTVSCPSFCGTYFIPYLKSVSVLASNPEVAKEIVKLWLEETGRKFLHKDWEVECIAYNISGESVIGYDESSDY